MNPSRTIPLRSEELESAFDWLADAARMGYDDIQSPPLVLWPETAVHAELPDDVRALIR